MHHKLYGPRIVYGENRVMFTDRNLRKQLGLTQGEMAAFLGVSRGYLSSVETDRRRFSSEVSDRKRIFEDGKIVAHFLNIVPGMETVEEKRIFFKEGYTKKIQKHIEKCRRRLWVLERKLKEMEEKYKEACDNLEMINACICTNKNRDPLVVKLFDYAKGKMELNVLKYDVGEQGMIKAAMEVVGEEIRIYERLL